MSARPTSSRPEGARPVSDNVELELELLSPPNPELDGPCESTPESRPLDVLVVDDDEDLRRYVRRALQRSPSDVRVDEASSGTLALQLLGTNRFDLVIADVFMPGVDGFELVSRIRTTHTAERLPILLMTGAGSQRDTKHRALSAGAQDVLAKPFNARKLCDAVARVTRNDVLPTQGPDLSRSAESTNPQEES